MPKYGIDVSYAQGEINWIKAKSSIDFAIVRGGYGKGHIDEYALYNLQKCNELGIPVGMYWFSYADTVDLARAEATYALELLRGYNITLQYPIYYDFEYASLDYAKKRGHTLDNKTINEMANAFCSKIERNNFYAGIYTNKDFIVNIWDNDNLSKYDIWYAYLNPELDRKVHLHQKSFDGSIQGINGKVDLDVDYIDLANVISKNNLNHFKINKIR